MALTDKLGQAFYFGEAEVRCDKQLARRIYQYTFETLYNSGAISGRLKMLDLGSGPRGSDFVNMLAEFSPQIEVTYLDERPTCVKNLQNLGKKAVTAPGEKMPFMNDSFDIIFGGWAILANDAHIQRDSKIIAEVRRVLCQQGIFVFEYVSGNDEEMKKHFASLGFNRFTHMLRLDRRDREYFDIYSASLAINR